MPFCWKFMYDTHKDQSPNSQVLCTITSMCLGPYVGHSVGCARHCRHVARHGLALRFGLISFRLKGVQLSGCRRAYLSKLVQKIMLQATAREQTESAKRSDYLSDLDEPNINVLRTVDLAQTNFFDETFANR